MNIISLLNLIMIIVIFMILFKINNDINKIKVVHDEKEENLGVTLNQVYNNQLYFNDILNQITDIMNNSTTEEEKNMLLTYLNDQLTNYKENVIDSENSVEGPVVELYEDADDSKMDLKDKLKKINDLIEDNKSKQEDLKKLVSELNINEVYNKYSNIENLVRDIMKKIEENIIIGDGDLTIMYDIDKIKFCKNEGGTRVCKKIKDNSVETLPGIPVTTSTSSQVLS